MADIPSIIEVGESGSGDVVTNPDGTESRRYTLVKLVSGPNGYAAAETQARALFPLVDGGHRRGRIGCAPLGGSWWRIEAEYSNNSTATFGDMQFGGWEMEWAQQSEHITQAWTDSVAVQAGANAYVSVYAQGVDGATSPGMNGTPDFAGAIGVQEDQVRGIDRPVSAFSWSETWHIPAWRLSKKRPDRVVKGLDDEPVRLPQAPLIETIENAVFTTNKKKFRGFESDDVLLTGVKTGRMDLGGSTVSLTFSFSAIRTRKDFLVGNILVAIKPGWWHMDVYYETASDSQQLVKRPKFVYVSKVFPWTDFDDLGLPSVLPDWWLPGTAPAHVFS